MPTVHSKGAAVSVSFISYHPLCLLGITGIFFISKHCSEMLIWQMSGKAVLSWPVIQPWQLLSRFRGAHRGQGGVILWEKGRGKVPRSVAVLVSPTALASVVHLSVSFLMGSVCRFLASWVLWVSTNAAVGSQAETRMTTYMYTHTHTRNIKSHECHSVSHFIHAFRDPLLWLSACD